MALAFNLKRVPLSQSDSDAEYDPPETVETIAASIRSLGHRVVPIEATRDFPAQLAQESPDVVFNISEGQRGRAREAHVPAVCEMMGIAYTGSDATTLALALDKALAKMILVQSGVPTPPYRLIRSPDDLAGTDLCLPVIVKPNCEGSSKGLLPESVVESADRLSDQVGKLMARYHQPVIVEQCLSDREFTVGFLGSGEPAALPILELQFLDKSRPPIYDIDLKQDPPDKIRHVCPAPLDDSLAKEIVRVARRAYHALGCRDIGRVDVRLDDQDAPQVIEVNPLPGLAPRYSDVCKMTESLGWSHPELITRILEPALERAIKLRNAEQPREVEGLPPQRTRET